jgi:biopolymer transport protein ExbD
MRRLGDRQRREEASAEINVAPLLDMVFILLIFFVVTAVFVEETGVEVERPSATAATALEQESLMLAITPDGAIHYAGQTYGLNSVRALVQRERSGRDLPVIVIADGAVPSRRLVDVIDEAKLGGAIKVSIAATSKGE